MPFPPMDREDRKNKWRNSNFQFHISEAWLIACPVLCNYNTNYRIWKCERRIDCHQAGYSDYRNTTHILYEHYCLEPGEAKRWRETIRLGYKQAEIYNFKFVLEYPTYLTGNIYYQLELHKHVSYIPIFKLW